MVHVASPISMSLIQKLLGLFSYSQEMVTGARGEMRFCFLIFKFTVQPLSDCSGLDLHQKKLNSETRFQAVVFHLQLCHLFVQPLDVIGQNSLDTGITSLIVRKHIAPQQ